MKIIEVNNPEQILEAKRILENTEDLQTFVNGLELQNTIFVKDDIVIPFSIKNDLLFLIADNNKDLLLNVLNTIDYNLDSLEGISMLDVYNGKLENEEFYFIIGSDYKILKK
jgi:uncharacterized lipoprotein YehR (DUF1307 family)